MCDHVVGYLLWTGYGLTGIDSEDIALPGSLSEELAAVARTSVCGPKLLAGVKRASDELREVILFLPAAHEPRSYKWIGQSGRHPDYIEN